MKILKFSILFLGLKATFANANNYKTVEYCIDSLVVSCFVGPYAYECSETALSCTSFASPGGARCIDPRIENFQCKAGTKFEKWITGDCRGGLVTGAVCG